MAREKAKKEMSKYFVYLFLFFQSLCQICHSLETVESQSQAFIQTDTNHLTYIIGDVSAGIPIEVRPGQVYGDIIGTEDVLLSSAIQLDPPMLDFQEQPVGMPRMEQVTVQNTDRKNNLHLLSISGSTTHFHCSFFQDKIVPPGGNTTFDVVFLARQEGNVENTLYIHTSLGSYKYQVFGVGIQNPYRLRPYLGARVPVNSSFAPLINMHNPHSSTLQVLEMFSSEGDLHLELPTGDKEAAQALWEIPPYETKTVMKANFIGRIENNHTAFIRIKTNQRADSDLLVLPMEIEVSSSPGVFAAEELIDFGILRTLDEPKTLPINLMNIGDSAVQITSITVSPPNKAVSVDFRPTKLQSDPERQITVGHLTFKAEKAIQPKYWSGKIVIRSKNNVYKISIPYQATVLHGSLAYHLNMTYFFAHNSFQNYSRQMSFTNTFNFSVVIYNVTLAPEFKHYFSISGFSKPVTIEPQKTMTPLVLRYHPVAISQHFRTRLILHTNASTFEIPLIVYNGQIQIIPHRPEKFEGQLDFGTMGVKENRSVLFTLVNDNPIEIYVYEYSTDMKGATLEVLGIEKGNGTTLSRVHNKTGSQSNGSPLLLQPYHYAVLSLNLVAPEQEGSYQAEVIIASQFQETFMPVLVRTAEGSLNAIPARIVFDKVFPGKLPYKVLQIHSTFEERLEVTRVAFRPPDTRFSYQQLNDKYIVLEPRTHTNIGKIIFDGKKECKDECYVGLPTATPAGHQWLLGVSLEKDVVETDHYLYSYFRQKWNQLMETERDSVNVTIELDTSTVQGFLFSAHAQLHWPDLSRKCRWPIKFPLTQIGNISMADFVVENPGNAPLLVQILPLSLYPNPQTVVDLVSNLLPAYFSEYVETDDKDIFTLPEVNMLNPITDSSINELRNFVDSSFGVKSHRETITLILQPGSKIKVQVGFQPKDDSLKTSLILIRNNLTIFDIMVLQGQGGRGEMKLNNRKPASTLQFDIAEKHLKNCDKRKHSKNSVPNFTVKRSFTLKNTGELPFYVHGYSINSAACEGYGFRVMDCEGFELLPNTSRKIDIAFTPDFTMSRIRRTLTVFTSLGGPFNYTLQATVPPHTLAKCSAALPRPNWEPVLYYAIVCFMGFLLFCVVVASYFEADRIFVADIFKRKAKSQNNGTQHFQKDKIFDLKSIANPQLTITPQKIVPVTTVPARVPHMTGPIIELKSSSIEHETRESLLSTIAGIVKRLFIRKRSSSAKKTENNNTEDQESIKMATKSNTPNSDLKSNVPKEKANATHDTIISEKSSHIQQKGTARRMKAANRRSHVDLTSVEHTSPSIHHHNERKQGNKSYTSTEKKSVDQGVNANKDKTQPLTVTNVDSSSVHSVIHMDVKSDDYGKQKKSKKLRSKPERDLINKDRLITQEADDKDETSSTTTDSSTGDGEEKTSSARDSTPEPAPPPKVKKMKNKSRHLEPLLMPQVDLDPNNDDFEVTSNSRALKKIKGAQKDVYGGNIFSPPSYELPYKMKNTTKSKKKKAASGIDDKLTEIPKPKDKGVVCDLAHVEDIVMETGDARESDSDSPPPQWDEPSPISHSGDLSELSIQTDQFVAKQSRALEGGTTPSFSPEGLTSSSRSSSYSSIVSNSSGEAPNNKNKDKRYPVGFTPFSEAIPGLAPMTPPIVATASNGKRNVWGTSSSPTTPDAVGFGLQTIQESSRTGTTLTDSQVDMFTQPQNFSFTGSVPSTTDVSYGFTSGLEQTSSSLTMMQNLQRDRRRRIREHQLKVMQGDDWPGFDYPITRSESLWDEYNPLEPGTTWIPNVAEGSSAPDSDPGLWNALTQGANSGWNSLMGIWGSSTSPAHPLSPEGGNSAGTGPPGVDAVSPFNPFSSDIWSPSASTATTGWNIPAQPRSDDQGN